VKVASPADFCVNTLLARPVGHESFTTMPRSNQETAAVDPKNIIETTEDDLSESQKGELARAMEEFKLTCLRSYTTTKRGEAIKKSDFPTPRHITIAEEPGKMQEMVNEAVHRAFVHHAKVMSNDVHNSVVHTLREGDFRYKGPAYEQTPKISHAPTETVTVGANTAFTQLPITSAPSGFQSI